MLDNENNTAAFEDDDVILPDGWQEGDDIFSEEGWSGDAGQADESAEDAGQSDEGNAEGSDGEAPTTEPDDQSGADGGDAGGEAPTTEPSAAEQPRKLKFTARVDRSDLDVEVDESELPTLYQKAQVVDRVRAKLAKLSPTLEKAERLSKSLGYDNLDAMLDSAEKSYRETEVNRLIGEGVHKEVAQDMVNRRFAAPEQPRGKGPSESETARPGTSGDAPQREAGAAGERDFRKEVADLLAVRGDLRGQRLPDEVIKACVLESKPLIVAYTEYEDAQKARQAQADAKERTALRRENAILKQNAASAARAPVSGATGGGATDTKPKDPFLEGFDADDY